MSLVKTRTKFSAKRNGVMRLASNRLETMWSMAIRMLYTLAT